MRVLIIGGTRRAGPYLVEELLDRGHAVTCYHRGQNNVAFSERAGHIHGDRRQYPEFKRQMQEIEVDAVIDMMAADDQDVAAVVAFTRPDRAPGGPRMETSHRGGDPPPGRLHQPGFGSTPIDRLSLGLLHELGADRTHGREVNAPPEDRRCGTDRRPGPPARPLRSRARVVHDAEPAGCDGPRPDW